ncbi:MAG: DUF5675 family protein [Bacteroidales bacterium]|jgi:hypothetical protein|nr:DUF5675 family protein [Bacteroidales bacterium]
MKLHVKRTALKPTYTIGKLYIDGEYFCDTLEDTVRASGVKIAGKTAIPAGTYKVILTYAPRFKRLLPWIQSVPNFEGILIHRGNTDADTSGCILVGKNEIVGKVIRTAEYELKLVDMLRKEKDITITIEN